MRRGDIYYADLGAGIGYELGGVRPVIIIQNNVGNRCSTTTIVIVLAREFESDKVLPEICVDIGTPIKKWAVRIEQIRTLDMSRLKSYIKTIDQKVLSRIDRELNFSLGL